MKKYDRKDFYVVRLGYINDANKFNYPGAAQDSLRFLNVYKKNGFFALTIKKDGYFVDLINGQIFGENTPFCVINKKSLAELLLGEGKITKREALLEMIYCLPLFATELGVDYANKSLAEDSFNIKVNKSVKYPIEVLGAKLKEIGYQGDYHMVYDTRDFFRKKFNNILKEKVLKEAATKHSINDFYFAIVKVENFPEVVEMTLFLKLQNGTYWDLLSDRTITSNNGYLVNSIIHLEPLANYSSLKGNIKKANALDEAKRYAEDFINSYKMKAKYDLSRSRK